MKESNEKKGEKKKKKNRGRHQGRLLGDGGIWAETKDGNEPARQRQTKAIRQAWA